MVLTTLKSFVKRFNGLLSNQTTGLYPGHENFAINIIGLFLSQLGSLNTLTPAIKHNAQLTELILN
ncbi:hypothetical protein HanRHA438_Chr03g0147941 [Helianthus annuus]|nr:hypothetical protein HanRHA438_Chr03g0147941 [Helianthus annuus]